MRVDKIGLESFRNIQRAEVSFAPGINVICGENAQGKTNLLEAVYMLAGARSFRTRFDRELISFGADFSLLDAEFQAAGRAQRVEMSIIRGQKKKILLNGVKTAAATLQGVLTAVLFCPEDLRIVSDGAAARRRLMDMAISQLRPGYAAALASMNRYHEQKIRILRDGRENPSLLKILDEFTAGLLKASAMLIRYRAAFTERMNGIAAQIHGDFSGGREQLELSYKTCSSVTDPKASASAIFEELLAHSAAHRDAEIKSGQCLTGAHRDDIIISINGISAREYASQGQTRTAALSLKLAESEVFLGETGEYPVLLLDDVLSELDAARQEFVLRRIKGGQTMITCCEGGDVAERTDGRVLFVRNGEIFER